MDRKPFISVCIPAYEKAAALQRLLKSISIQSFGDFEVIITDDSRSDAVEKIVSTFTNKIPVHYYRNTPALGMGKNWNECIRKAAAPWIKMMHDDDWFADETALGKFAGKAQSAKTGFIASASYQVYAGENSSAVESFYKKEKELLELLPWSLFFQNTIGSPSVTMFKKDTDIVFDERFKWVIDIDFYLRYLEKHLDAYTYIEDPLVCITRDKDQVSASCSGNPNVEIPEYLDMLAKFNEDIHLQNKYAFYCVWELVRKFSISGKTQLLKYGYNGITPKKLDGIIAFQRKIPRLILKQTPWNRWVMQKCFNKLRI